MAGGNGVKGGISHKDRECNDDHNKLQWLSSLPGVQQISHFFDYFVKIREILLLSLRVIIQRHNYSPFFLARPVHKIFEMHTTESMKHYIVASYSIKTVTMNRLQVVLR
jgi:hypothetical protein